MRAGVARIAFRALRAGFARVTFRPLRAGFSRIAFRALRAGVARVTLRTLRAGFARVTFRALRANFALNIRCRHRGHAFCARFPCQIAFSVHVRFIISARNTSATFNFPQTLVKVAVSRHFGFCVYIIGRLLARPYLKSVFADGAFIANAYIHPGVNLAALLQQDVGHIGNRYAIHAKGVDNESILSARITEMHLTDAFALNNQPLAGIPLPEVFAAIVNGQHVSSLSYAW